MTEPVLVIGATGTVGRPLVQALAAAGQPVLAASRQATPLPGAEAVALDLDQPATLDAPIARAGAVYAVVPSGYLDVQTLLAPVIAAAARHGTKVVLQSVMGVDADDSIPYRQVELALIGSGAPHVILRPNWFADNFATYWRPMVEAGEIALPAGDGASSFVAATDIAASAAAALTSARFDGRAFDLTGPEALSYARAAGILSGVTGRPIAYHATDDAAFIAAMTAAGVPQDYAAFLAGIFHPVREGWTARTTNAVRELTGRSPLSLQNWAEAALAPPV